MRNIPTAVRIEEAATEDALEALREEWALLAEQAPSATPFQSPEWLLPWWRHFGSGALWALALRRGEALIGLAPLFLSTVPGPSGQAQRKVALMGSGAADYLDILCRADAGAPGAAALYRRLRREQSRWDVCDFHEVRASSPLLLAPAPSQLSVRIRPLEACPVLALPRSLEEFRAALPPGQRVRLQRARSALGRAGAVAIERADGDTVPEFLGDLFRLRRACREGTGPAHSAGDVSDITAPTAAFYRDVAEGMFRRGLLRLYRLLLDGAPAAALLGFQSKGVFYCLLAEAHPGSLRLNPGLVLMQHAIESALEEGATEFDFLRGREKHKYLWGAQDRMNYRLMLSGAPFAGDEPPVVVPPAPGRARALSPAFR